MEDPSSYEAREAKAIEDIATSAIDRKMTDQQFASWVVTLLILDKGNLNKYDQTILLCLKVFRRLEELRKA